MRCQLTQQHQKYFFTEKILGAVIRTRSRGARTKYAIHCAVRRPPPAQLDILFVYPQSRYLLELVNIEAAFSMTRYRLAFAAKAP